MTDAGFAYSHLFNKNLPPPAPRWTGFPKYNFIGGHNDPERIPAAALAEAATTVLRRRGADLALYNFDGPQGYRGLREFVVDKVSRAPGDQMLGRRRPDHLGLRAGHRPRQPAAARARRHRDPRRIHLWRRADQAEAARRQRHRRAARRRGAEDRRARPHHRGSRAKGHRSEIRLHDPDDPEPDRLDPAARAPRSSCSR